MEQGCLGLTSWAQVQLKQDKQGDVHFQTGQDSLGEPAFAAGETRLDFLTLGQRFLPTTLRASQRVRGWASESR